MSGPSPRLSRIVVVSLVMVLWVRSALATPDPLRGSVSWEQLKITTARGAIQILRPKSDVSPHQVVVYVHGYGGRVDELWTRHRLPEQFKKSGLNAIFVAVEAPAWYTDKVRFPSLDRVLSLLQRRLGVKLPSDVIVVGHSAAYLTFLHWLGNRRLRHLILLDALYAGVSRLASWVRYHPEHRLTVVLRSRLPVYKARLLFALTRKHRGVCRR
ncbi:MAG: hypothetical protein KAI47_07000, partial [Deltaproteobacteria bacterium]|nr:hypothetical protein [Deltaproteobacteria bacterium]